MPENSADEILTILSGKTKPRVLILGYSYKANVGDTRETPVEYLGKRISDRGCEVFIHDSLIEIEETPEWGKEWLKFQIVVI